MGNKFIPLSVPNLKGNELKYVTEAVESEWVSTAGNYVNEFEKSIAAYLHVKDAVSCQNGTSGLHLSLICSGVTKEDAVIVPTLTFIAAVNPVSYIGAEPIFMDCDDSLCMDPLKLAEFCETECAFNGENLVHIKSNKIIRALVVVHVFGNMADLVSIKSITDKYNISLIEDATEALGSKYISGEFSGKYAGTIGDFGVYSFNGNKIITTGGGGMIVSTDPDKLSHAKHLSTQAKSDELYFMHDEIGFNYRLTNLQAALGLAQLEQLEEFIKVKTHNYKMYFEAFKDVEGLEILPYRSDIRSNYWFYALKCDGFKFNKYEIIEHLSNDKIQTRPIWGLISEQVPYQRSITFKIQLANYYWENIVNLPCSSNLSNEDVKRVITSLLSM